MNLIDAFRIGWREADKLHRESDISNFDEDYGPYRGNPVPSEDEIRRLLGLQPASRPARAPEPHELSEVSIG